MNADRLIALSDKVPASFTNPMMLGALRPSDGPYFARLPWVAEARNAAASGKRVVLSGDFLDFIDIATALLEIAEHTPSARFAILLHWTQALHLTLIPELNGLFDDIYVAVDRPLARAQVVQINQHWNPKWILIPSKGVTWSEWVSETLFPVKAGSLVLLAPSASANRNCLSADELRLELETLASDHPDIKVEPAPCEWFVPGELGPWRMPERDLNRCTVMHDSRTQQFYQFTAVIPFRLTEAEADIALLKRCIASIQRTFAHPGLCEIIVALDCDSDDDTLAKIFSPESISDCAVIDVPRHGTNQDWRAGFVRNAGAMFASRANETNDRTILFIDADTEIAQPDSLRAALDEKNFDVLQLADDPRQIGFEHATSMFIAVKQACFVKLGGFANAFSHYGAEDAFLIWKATKAGARILPLTKSHILNLRPPQEADDLFLKMNRLRESAGLMYRMTLDPSVHRHFYVCLGRQSWARAAAKAVCESNVGRFVIAPIVFFFTLIETNRQMQYLRSFYEVDLKKFALFRWRNT